MYSTLPPLVPILETVKVPEPVNLWYLKPPVVNMVPPVALIGTNLAAP
jgi:hypothetical protein